GIAYTSAHTMTKTVNDIILFSELMSGDPTMMLSRFNLRSAIETLLASVQNKCNEKSIALHTTFTIPRSEIVCDERKLIRAISHLLDNAIKYSDQGTVSLNVSAAPSPDAPHQSQLYIRIEDEGPGIDDSLFENLFLPFAQGNSAWNRKFQGIGLGLAMSHMIMSSLGGTLSVSNRQNASGVIALATVPCTFIEKDTSKIENDALMADTESTQAPPRYALIVEDNITNQIILKKLLENIGLITSIAQNGEEAIKQVRENYYDIVFMDCQMPVMDGFEATKAIRQLQTQNKRTPIIAITANTRDADKAKCLEVGMDDFLEKPINLPHIELTVNKYLQHRSSQGPTPTNSAYTTNS
ncbi:MAG: response regulator, partial [Gammaproteobacteria bacterium]